MKKKFKTIIVLPTIILICLLTGCASKYIEDVKAPQNNLIFAKNNPVYQVKPLYQQQLAKNFLQYYYIPWQNPYYFQSVKSIGKQAQGDLRTFLRYPGWGMNKQPLSQEWIMTIIHNANMEQYPNTKRKAITVVATPLRVLPTITPSFTNWTDEGEGYPFDNLQASNLKPNLPLYVLHTSRDGQWLLVSTSYKAIGWVQTKDIAYVSAAFIKQWQRAHYVTPIKEKLAVRGAQGAIYFATIMGQIYPLAKVMPNDYEILVAVMDRAHHAVIQTAHLTKNDAALWPLVANTNNLAVMANKLLDLPYGWGGLNGYRDCSATLMDLFAPFGIWLPRNSAAQALSAPGLPVFKYSNSQKEAALTQYGIPFFTLIGMNGHIMLYIGTLNGKAYAFHAPWGLHTYRLFHPRGGRAVIGRTSITALDFGKEYWNVKFTWLDIMQGMTWLVPRNEFESTPLAQKI